METLDQTPLRLLVVGLREAHQISQLARRWYWSLPAVARQIVRRFGIARLPLAFAIESIGFVQKTLARLRGRFVSFACATLGPAANSNRCRAIFLFSARAEHFAAFRSSALHEKSYKRHAVSVRPAQINSRCDACDASLDYRRPARARERWK